MHSPFLCGHRRSNRVAALMACVVALPMSMQAVVFIRSAVAEPAAREMSVKEIRELVDEAEKLLGRPLSHGMSCCAAARVHCPVLLLANKM